ncbi:uncharacterized protein BYT42DRAFT_564913 [Radiomyces spectabilis]|uniref:uncharacterized protein n=1 Tax=Radiomyces spectabilis TaxID=64574 RepID=UPI0022203A19|nr:uncharacterized protein BYT42DRAFT_564913 [Radiomyces spectabilis]KAI8381004.1 hypothetical protein BYT42DRAFT_564913 [Radiomyces spectabilis]
MLQRISHRLSPLSQWQSARVFVRSLEPVKLRSAVAVGPKTGHWTHRLVSGPLGSRSCSSAAHELPATGRKAAITPKPIASDKGAYKTMAFYKIHALPEASLLPLRKQLLTAFEEMGIVGRIYISVEGINAQLSCPEASVIKLRDYCEHVLKPMFGGSLMDLNFATEHGPRAFRALHVRIRKQLVADGLDPATYDLTSQPSHLSPKQWHEKLLNYKKKHGKDPVLIDMRNHYESEIGFFEGAIRPDVSTFKGSMKAMNEITKDLPRDQEVFMYCTGGIRCSKAGAILQSASGFRKVHLVEGGITAYGRWIEEEKQVHSLFRGKNFTFDARMGERITDEVFTRCHICGEPCNRYQNCAHASCNLLLLCCPKCAAQFKNTCGRIKCYDTVNDYMTRAKKYFNPDGPVTIDGVRAYIKQGESPEHPASKDAPVTTDRVVVGKSGEQCELGHDKRIRAAEVLGEPRQVLQEWVKAGRPLPEVPSKL